MAGVRKGLQYERQSIQYEKLIIISYYQIINIGETGKCNINNEICIYYK